MPMANYDRVDPHNISPQRVSLDERFLALFLPDDPQDRLEAQELRQIVHQALQDLIVHQALQDLTPREFRVIELRYQNKKSPGQAASLLGIPREEMQKLEKKGLEKLRQRLQAWYMES